MNKKRFLFAVIGIALILAAACNNPTNPFFPPKKGGGGNGNGNGNGNGGGNGTVNAEAPQISGHPQSAVYSNDVTPEPLSVSASVSDGGTLSYQWYKNAEDNTSGGTPIQDAIGASYAPPPDANTTVWYYVVVTNTNNSAGGNKTATATSRTAEIAFNNLVHAGVPHISANLHDAEYGMGEAAQPLSATATVTDGGTLSYQWYQNTANSNEGGTPIQDATATSYTPPTAEVGTVWYYVVVTNTNNSATGNKAATGKSSTAKITVMDMIIVKNTGDWNNALTTISNGTRPEYIVKVVDETSGIGVPGNTTTTSSFGSANVTVTLRGSGRLYLTGSGSMIRLGGSQTLIIDSEDLVLEGRINGRNGQNSHNNISVVYIDDANAKLELHNGTIRGNTSSGSSPGYGGGVYVNNGSFVMSGGTISGNSAMIAANNNNSISGGGVYVNNGRFTMSGGTISDNLAQGRGSGGYGYGGGVYVNNDGFFTMSGGTISNNTATVVPYSGGSSFSSSYAYGGGVYNRGGFTMTGGTISGNTASVNGSNNPVANGGGVYNTGTFRISGGVVYGSSEADISLRNTISGGSTSSGAALFNSNSGTAERGTFSGEIWNSLASLVTTNNTIRVTNGVSGGVGNILAPVWRDGNSVFLATPSFPAVTVTSQDWQISDNGTSGWANFTPPATANMSYDGKYLRYYIISGGQTYYSDTITIRVLSPTAPPEVTIAMWDSAGDGWDTNAALRVTVNGTNRATNARLVSGRGPDCYPFTVSTGDVVQIYWVNGGEYDRECAFAVYYSDDPPNPAFSPTTDAAVDTSGRLLLHRQYRPSGSAAFGNGTLMGSFTVP